MHKKREVTKARLMWYYRHEDVKSLTVFRPMKTVRGDREESGHSSLSARLIPASERPARRRVLCPLPKQIQIRKRRAKNAFVEWHFPIVLSKFAFTPQQDRINYKSDCLLFVVFSATVNDNNETFDSFMRGQGLRF